MRKKLSIIFLGLILAALTACGDDANNDTNLDELVALDVESFDVPKEADVDETVEFATHVIYGDEDVTDADEVVYEIWEEGDKDNSEKVDATDNEDGGIYTIETSFDHDGLFHVQVHVTARDMHTMPKKEITVGEGGDYEEASDEDDEFHTEGFNLHFMDPEDPEADEEVDLITHIDIDDETLEDAQVRYEISNDASDQHEWIDADETEAGEYTGVHTFPEEGTYTMVIHVEDDDDLHEHKEFEIDVE